ncbi:GntR family transcriptional regulator [Bradyrhizobium tropiciagri]|uniref:GntR family transcriptional regulator n=1 Tax=Bradyrhizobium tropiciagri TaxID=312253 RepID=UPI0020118D9D|nr:GntR family transcriptional regulator [Bradyrhizobium tropiciagri]
MTAQQRRRLRVPRVGLHEQAAARLRTMIVRGELAPGQSLGEADLSDALGISRTPLREALKQLANEGLVELRLNHSAVVAPFRRAELTELFEAVSGIERCAAELAAQRMEDADFERLEALQDKIEWHHGRGELRDYFQVNQQIHSAIVSFARNAVLKATHEALLARAERARFFALSVLGRWDESVREHQEILAALRARDAARAGQVLAHHVRRTGEIVAETLDGTTPDDKTLNDKADDAAAPEAPAKPRGRKTRNGAS